MRLTNEKAGIVLGLDRSIRKRPTKGHDSAFFRLASVDMLFFLISYFLEVFLILSLASGVIGKGKV